MRTLLAILLVICLAVLVIEGASTKRRRSSKYLANVRAKYEKLRRAIKREVEAKPDATEAKTDTDQTKNDNDDADFVFPDDLPEPNMGACEMQQELGESMEVGFLLDINLQDPPYTDNQNAFFNKLHPVLNSREKKAVRKEIRQLTSDEWQEVIKAFWALKNTLIDGTSAYDLFYFIHDSDYAPASTRSGPGQLTWHREYIVRMEQALMLANPKMVGLPYWDVTLETDMPDITDSVFWSEEFLGGCDTDEDEYESTRFVTKGNFANWTTPDFCDDTSLTRDCGQETTHHGFNDKEWDIICSYESFGDMYTEVGNCMTVDHDLMHIFVSGTTHGHDIRCVVGDPLSWFFHAFVDKLWEDYRSDCQTTDIESDWVKDPDTEYHAADTQLYPFKFRNKDGLTKDYTKYFYEYEKQPKSCSEADDCGNTKYLYCSSGRCQSKVKSGGSCLMTNSDICLEDEYCDKSIEKCASRTSQGEAMGESSNINSGLGTLVGPINNQMPSFGMPPLRLDAEQEEETDV